MASSTAPEHRYVGYSRLNELITLIKSALNGKVDKDGKKVLTDVNFTSTLNTKLDGIEEEANKTFNKVLINGASTGVTSPLNEPLTVDLKVPKTPSSLDGGYVTQGFNSKASGQTKGTKATSEGQNTLGTGTAAHAEGNATTAAGTAAHAEGDSTVATSNYSHAEGYKTSAEANSAHAEGESTVAKGNASHAGGLGTVAASQASTAIGKYNKENSELAFQIGNGSSASDRKDIFSVNWDGSIKFTGKINDVSVDFGKLVTTDKISFAGFTGTLKASEILTSSTIDANNIITTQNLSSHVNLSTCVRTTQLSFADYKGTTPIKAESILTDGTKFMAATERDNYMTISERSNYVKTADLDFTGYTYKTDPNNSSKKLPLYAKDIVTKDNITAVVAALPSVEGDSY